VDNTYFIKVKKIDEDLYLIELKNEPRPSDIPILKEELDNLPKNTGYCLKLTRPWLVGFIVHELHPTKYVAVWDDELGGCIVIQTHTKDMREGYIIPLK